MKLNSKEWLVRTRSREILGPFDQKELLEHYQHGTFGSDDEIAPSSSFWISAQTLSQRDFDEITRTSTRNQTITSSILQGELTPTPTVTPTITPVSGFDLGNSSKTSTSGGPTAFNSPESLQTHKPNSTPLPYPSEGAPLTKIITVLVLGVGFLLLVSLGTRPPKVAVNENKTPVSNKLKEAESPFMAEVHRLIDSGENQAALKKLSVFHEKHQGKQFDYLIPYASLLITEGESPLRAKKLLEQLLRTPQSPELKSRAHHWLGYLLLSQDEGDMGESHFLEALQLNPKDAAARFNLGRAYLKQEKFSQALDYLQLAELEMPNLWLIHIYKGWARMALGNKEEAKSSFKTAIQSSKDRWMTYIYYSIFLLRFEEYDEAKATLKQMLTYDPNYELNSPPPIEFFQSKVNYNDYLTAYNKVMDRGSNDEREMGQLYLTYLLNNSSARNDWKRMVNIAEKSGSLWPKVIALKMMLDHEENLLELKTQIARLQTPLEEFGPFAYVLRGEAYHKLNQMAEAQNDFQRALTLDPKAAASHWAYAKLLKRLNRREEAKREISSLLSYHPNYIPAIVSAQNF